MYCSSFQNTMPQEYTRKTQRGSATGVLQRAAEAVQGGLSVRAAAENFNVDRMTLSRYIAKKKENPHGVHGYANCKLSNLIFTSEMEADLAMHIKDLAARYHGLSKDKCRALIYEYATRNNVKVPENWSVKKKAGEAFWLGLKKRQSLAIRGPRSNIPGSVNSIQPTHSW
ncbi:hypothetical protein HOLleu_03095 [Holothuria leucospilota]|uniref:HTH psq-type domain-containing protein n=1 Tax=Holothuria leucospilota TaxID=206669 RepID=A0A9Q1HHF3_HOLLE|nr:hypothetical protein HOLleu_03095 [Holothuria leucospilota]